MRVIVGTLSLAGPLVSPARAREPRIDFTVDIGFTSNVLIGLRSGGRDGWFAGRCTLRRSRRRIESYLAAWYGSRIPRDAEGKHRAAAC